LIVATAAFCQTFAGSNKELSDRAYSFTLVFRHHERCAFEWGVSLIARRCCARRLTTAAFYQTFVSKERSGRLRSKGNALLDFDTSDFSHKGAARI
jgi:hypothetical protein